MGSLPSDVSIEKQEYYAKKTNDFWKLMSLVLNFDLVSMSYDERICCLLENKVGLWDVFKASVRVGSLDSEIRDVELNDFGGLKKVCPELKLVCLNGKKAGEYRYLFEGNYLVKVLPSSSGANRRDNQRRIEE